MNHLIEILMRNLKPSSHGEFRRLYIEEVLPHLQRWNLDVVAHGPSLHDENKYYAIRFRNDEMKQGLSAAVGKF